MNRRPPNLTLTVTLCPYTTRFRSGGATFGIRPFGVEAQRILRLEKGHVIVGQDTDGLTHPHEAGMEWAISRAKPFFLGGRAIAMLCERGLERRLVGFILVDPAGPKIGRASCRERVCQYV